MPGQSTPPARRRFGAGGPTLVEIGERALLEQLVAISSQGSELGPRSGDDAAVWAPRPGRDLAVSIDALVEDVDFRRSWIEPRQLGRRAFAVAVSDVAAMGAVPLYCVATLCARGSEQLDDVLEIQRGLCEAASAVGCVVVGGDVSAIEGPLVIDVCVTGSLGAGRALRRAGGRPGDLLLVTGVLGRSAAGLRLLLQGADPASAVERGWVDAHLQPVTRLGEGARLLQSGVSCAGDLSDGVLVDVSRTASASGCGAQVWADSIPVDAHLSACFGRDWLELAVGGGEDFELLAAVAEADVESLTRDWPARLAPLTIIGALDTVPGVRLLDRRGGAELTPPATLASHFS